MYFIVIGCGKVGSQLAKFLSENHNVVVIDKNASSFQALQPVFNGITITGNCINLDVLRDAGIERCDGIAAVTSDDNVNIVVGQIAKKMFNINKCIIRIVDPVKNEIYRKLGYDVISGQRLVAAIIRDKLIEKGTTTYIVESGDITFLEILINGKKSGTRVSDLNIPEEFKVVVVVKQDGPVIPDDGYVVKEGDLVIGVARMKSMQRIKKILEIT
ncbi:MAG TPA: TrkA family potassium uptake protein [bacterium]|nr:TrkA family potassium uptake protein [bacterium]HOL34489.1 TrkA family potassium uptake protein [bacterium]HPP08453.1 TrkA family potassium uptake protein [bacterium]